MMRNGAACRRSSETPPHTVAADAADVDLERGLCDARARLRMPVSWHNPLR
jgi:hypothetical protein